MGWRGRGVLDFGFWILDSSLCYARATPYVFPFSFFRFVGCISGQRLGIGGQLGAAMHRLG